MKFHQNVSPIILMYTVSNSILCQTCKHIAYFVLSALL